MTTVVIDDEELAVKGLTQLLDQYRNTFEILAIARNGLEAVEIVDKFKPEVIFLDIEMPVYNGFEMLGRLTYLPIVVFTTAYDEFAVKAFEANSLDYLLKPIEKQRFDLTVQRLIKSLNNNAGGTDFQKIAQFVKEMQSKKEMHSMTVRLGEKILFIPLTEISHFSAEDRYVFLNTMDGKKYLTDHTIQSLESMLPRDFTRVNRGSIINTKHILEAQRYFAGKYVIQLKDVKKSKVETSRKYIENLGRIFGF